MNDPLGADRLRQAALLAWTAHPGRFREDANAEEDQAVGHYRDRVVVELAQNAADAARRAGVPGRLLLRLTGAPATLVAANTGAPLDAAGLASMASLRASAAGAGSVGRFGVGFAAVRSVADEVAVLGSAGAVHFSLARSAALLAGLPELADEVARRDGSLPALRLPFAGPGDLEVRRDGWETAVVLRLRDDAAAAQVAAQLAAVDDALLLALPGLASVEIEVEGERRVVADVADRWVTASAGGVLPGDLLASRPVEERERPGWTLTWAVPRVPAAGVHTGGGVLHAPTPTDEPCTVPALLLATWPLDASRRHVVPGPVTDHLVAHAGQAWAGLLLACRDELAAGRPAPDPLDLLPGGWPAGSLDAALREAVLAATRSAPVLTGADGTPVAPAQASVLEPPFGADQRAVRLLGPWLAGLVQLDPQPARTLGVATVPISAVVEQLPADADLLHALADLVAEAGPDVVAELATAPVPLVDGRVVHGVRGLVLAQDVPDAALRALAGWGLRVVDPRADHPVLERLGAVRLDAAALAAHPVLRERVLDGSVEATQVLLTLLAAAGIDTHRPGAPSWWGEALLPAADGELSPARGLTRPGSPGAAWFDPAVLPAVAAGDADRWGRTLLAVGVRDGLVVEPVDELVVTGLDGWAEYLQDVGADEADTAALGAAGAVVLADLDAVLPGAWPQVLAALALRPARDALEPVRLDGRTVPSWTAWWLRERADLDLPGPFALPGGAATGLLPPVPDVLAPLLGDQAVLRALGGVGATDELDGQGWTALLGGVGRAGEVGEVGPALALGLWRAVARPDLAGIEWLADAPALPAVEGGVIRLAPTDDVAVADPMWARHPRVQPALVVPTGRVDAVAEALDLDTAADRTDGAVTSHGSPVALPATLLALEGLLVDRPVVVAHADLRVDGLPVPWWVRDGVVHVRADGDAGDLAAALGHAGVADGSLLLAVLGGRPAVDAVLDASG